jgi:hypothetical protein
MADKAGMQVDIYHGGLEHNDWAILEGDNFGFIKVVCKTGMDEIAKKYVYKIESGGTSLFDPYPWQTTVLASHYFINLSYSWNYESTTLNRKKRHW